MMVIDGEDGVDGEDGEGSRRTENERNKMEQTGMTGTDGESTANRLECNLRSELYYTGPKDMCFGLFACHVMLYVRNNPTN